MEKRNVDILDEAENLPRFINSAASTTGLLSVKTKVGLLDSTI